MLNTAWDSFLSQADQSSPYSPGLCRKIQANIVIVSTLRPSKGDTSFRFSSTKNLHVFLFSSMGATCSYHLITLYFNKMRIPCILGWNYIGATWLYCDYFVWCVSCNVVVLNCFILCGWVYVGVFWQLLGCFGNVNLYLSCFVLYALRFCIVSFMYIYSYFFVCASVRTIATEWKLNCNNNNNNNNV